MSDEPEETSAIAEDAPRPKKKKKKKRSVSADREGASPRDEVDDLADESRPAFARAFPKDEELDRLVALFEDGRYDQVKTGAVALARKTEDDDVRRAARELERRLEPDPLARTMLLGAAVLLAFLAYWFWTHPHAVAP